jgi:hypothetical protein
MWLQKHLRQEQKNEMSMTSPAGIWQPLFLQPPNWCKQLDECLGLQSTVPRQRQRDSPIDRMTSFWGLKEKDMQVSLLLLLLLLLRCYKRTLTI